MNTVRIGVLGARRGMALAEAMALAPSATLAAVCDTDPQRLAAVAPSVPQTCLRYGELLEAADVDAVLVASPMPLHVPHAVAALRAGKHVLCEVTAATSIEQCCELLEAVRASGCQYMLAENYCYYRPWMIVLGMVRAGLFGQVYYGEADQIQDLKGGLLDPDAGYNWRTAELALRRGHQYITHNLGPLYQAMGQDRIRTVVCLGSGQHHLAWARADDTCVVLGQTAGGKLVRIRLDFFSTRPQSFTYFGLQGTGASYEGPRGPREAHKVHVQGQTPPDTWQSLEEFAGYLPPAWTRIPADRAAGYDGGAALMIEDFARAVLDGTRPPIDVVDAVNMTAAGLVSEVSIERGGAPVDVPEFG
ncbi:MAG: Gfo/Idh/MocA family oxidoreductase [Candidatus Latescibacterota bacterium]